MIEDISDGEDGYYKGGPWSFAILIKRREEKKTSMNCKRKKSVCNSHIYAYNNYTFIHSIERGRNELLPQFSKYT